MADVTDAETQARVQIWAKGISVSDPSEEFQLVVPPQKSQLTGVEQDLLAIDWARTLDGLYRDTLLSRHFAVLFREDEVLACAAASSQDHRKRPSVVLVAAVGTCNWSAPNLAVRVAQLRGLTDRLASTYAKVLAESDSRILQQLRKGRFLPDRGFDLAREQSDRVVRWDKLINEVRKYKGVRGIATPGLVGIGANVLYGTDDELQRARSSFSLDGRFDVAGGRLQTLGSGLTLWAVLGEVTTQEPELTLDQKVDHLASRLDAIESAVSNIQHLTNAIFDRLGRVAPHIDEKVVKKKRW